MTDTTETRKFYLDVSRIIDFYSELVNDEFDELAAKLQANPVRFFEWNAETMWAVSITREHLNELKKHTAADINDDDAINTALNAILAHLTYIAVQRAERRVETSTAANRMLQTIATESALARLCATFKSAFTFMRDTNHELHASLQQRMNAAIMRGY